MNTLSITKKIALSQEIKVKMSPKAEKMKNAPDEVIAMAIRDTLLKDKEKK